MWNAYLVVNSCLFHAEDNLGVKNMKAKKHKMVIENRDLKKNSKQLRVVADRVKWKSG